jgi:nucleoside-diphosphate-sugar epimerase
MVQGKMKDGLQGTGPVFTFVDVRDVAHAHVVAMDLPGAGGHRFYLVAEHFSNNVLADIIREAFPDLADRLPPEDACVDDMPEKVYGFDNSKSRDFLGIQYKTLEESVNDTVESILELEDPEGLWAS